MINKRVYKTLDILIEKYRKTNDYFIVSFLETLGFDQNKLHEFEADIEASKDSPAAGFLFFKSRHPIAEKNKGMQWYTPIAFNVAAEENLNNITLFVGFHNSCQS